jgi:small GTP-binding protein
MANLTFKIMILGESGVGKSCLMNKYLGKAFLPHNPATIGVEFESHKIAVNELNDDYIVSKYYQRLDYLHLKQTKKLQYYREDNQDDFLKLCLWNSAGQDKFRSIVASYFRKTQGVIFVFDLTRPHSLEKIEHWIEDFRTGMGMGTEKEGFGVPAILVGNKKDLVINQNILLDLLNNQIDNDDDKIELDQEIIIRMKKIAEKYHMPCFLVSAKKQDTEDLDPIFKKISAMILKQFLDQGDIDDASKANFFDPDKNMNQKSCCFR